MKYGRLQVLREVTPMLLASGRKLRRAAVQCDCGTKRIVTFQNLKSGRSQSCGCVKGAKVRHGDARKGNIAPEYACWQSMIRRCTSPTRHGYADYGGRGISVCDRWMTYENFLADVGRRPSSHHSLEREDNDGNYEPTNCRWATAKEQRANQRKRLRIDQFSNDELAAELIRRGYYNPLRVVQHH